MLMKTSEKILEYLKRNDQVTGNEFIDYLGITGRAVRKQLKSLLEAGLVTKIGIPPKVYYSLAPQKVQVAADNVGDLNQDIVDNIAKEFFYISPRGTIHEGWEGFTYWCREGKLDIRKMALQYKKASDKYDSYKKDGFISGISKIKATFDDVALDELFYIDFYSMEVFGKTRLGQLLLFAKQSQDRKMINNIADIIEPSVLKLMEQYKVDGVGFIPPTVKRELQLMKQIQNRLNLSTKTLSITKIKTPVAVPQKTLNKIEDRIINAKDTMNLDDTSIYNNILLIDDAVGSGATLNEMAKKIRQKGICKGKIVGLAITGSFKGFDVISEV
jgi:DNA-binding transcriptional ArsR family regulator